jgi:type I restriction enzyme M protein
LLIFRKSKPAERRDKVLFIDASKRFVAGKNQNFMSEEDTTVIATAYKHGVDIDGVRGLSLRLVDLEEVAENGFDLNIGRYLKTESIAEVNVEEALIAYQESREELSVAEAELADKLKAAGFDI